MPEVVVQLVQYPITVSTVGVQGPSGPPGLPGGLTRLQDMLDVVVSSPQQYQFLKYMDSKWTNVNTEIIDGGNW